MAARTASLAACAADGRELDLCQTALLWPLIASVALSLLSGELHKHSALVVLAVHTLSLLWSTRACRRIILCDERDNVDLAVENDDTSRTVLARTNASSRLCALGSQSMCVSDAQPSTPCRTSNAFCRIGRSIVSVAAARPPRAHCPATRSCHSCHPP